MKFVIERLQRIFRLSPSEWVILAQAWGFVLLVDLALRILPFKRLPALFQRRSLKTRAHGASAQPSVVPRLVRLVEVAGRYAPVEATCLKKALVLSWLLGRRGIATALRIGVARREGELMAHAWLEPERQVVLGLPGGDGYEPLSRGVMER